MRVLIIGSSGSIGKHLTSFLNSSKKIKEVYAIDKKKDKQISKKVKFKKLDLEYLKSDTKFSKKIDCAIILGAIVNFKNLDPLEFHYKNMIIFYNSIKICNLNNIKKIIYLSSFAVYGDLNNSSISEKFKLNGNNIYSNLKIFQEQEIQKLSTISNFEYCILRLSQIYGANIFTNIIYRFIDMKKKNEVVEINGDGSQKRDFLFIDDLIRAIYFSIIKFRGNSIFNVCTGIGATLKEVVDIIGVKYLLNRKKIREPKVVIGNNNKIKKALNWNIKFDVKKGIRKLI